MIKKSKFKLLMLSVLLPILLVSSGINALEKIQQLENISDNVLNEGTLQKNKIGKKDGIITINGEKVYYVPDSKIKISSDTKNTNVKFVKPEELSSDEIVCKIFREGSPRATEVQQGTLGACTFLAGLSGLAENNPDFIKDNLIEYNNDFVIVRFFNPENGLPFLYIMVQKTIPNLSGERAFLKNNCLWVHMYLKACVALEILHKNGDSIDYETAISETPSRMFFFVSMVTGKELKSENPRLQEEECLYKKIKKTLKSSGVVLCGFEDDTLSETSISKYFSNKVGRQGFVTSHTYSVTQVLKDKNGIKWIFCRNPWGWFVPTYDSAGNLYTYKDRNTDGYFWLKFKDFYKSCDQITYFTEESKTDNKGF